MGRQGCKAVVSDIIPSNELPFDSNGLTPDIIFSPHSFPTR